MPRDLTYAELFAGAGGLSMGLEIAGWRCVAHAEIEPHARAVLRKHWPDVRLDGDVTQINGAEYAGVTLLSGGSPCQDLSIAGKRKGLGGARSGLFHEQVRIWRESGAPLFLWENVLGALSSNNGGDFGVVLSTIVGGAVPVPTDGWGSAGVASGPAGVAAWRVLDGQFFGRGTLGTPQRRRRVFVLGVADGSVDPAEVLSLGESLSGHPAAGREAGQGVAADTGSGVEGAERGHDGTHRASDRLGGPAAGMGGFNARVRPDGVRDSQVAPTLDAGEWRGPNRNQGGVIADGNHAESWAGASVEGAIRGAIPLDVRNATRTTDASEQNRQGLGVGEDGDPSPTLTGLFTPAVLTYDTRGNKDGRVVNTMAGDHQNRVTDYTALVLQRGTKDVLAFDAFNQQDTGSLSKTLGVGSDYSHVPIAMTLRNREGKPGGGKGPLVSAERSLTLGTANDQVVFTKQAYGQYADAPSVASTLGARDHAATNIDIAVGVGIPRRLTPLECERLMSWPDHHTAIGIDEKGREYALSDTARYKLCGNGVLSACVAWIGMRLKDALDSRQAVV